VHTDNGRLYYGARYYDANQELVQEDTLLARVVSNITNCPPYESDSAKSLTP
jgi:hypothetical protein